MSKKISKQILDVDGDVIFEADLPAEECQGIGWQKLLVELSANKKSKTIGLTKLRGANFRGWELDHVSFAYRELPEADFREANLESCSFQKANLNAATFKDANCYRANFVDAKMNNTNLQGADLREVNLAGIDLTLGMIKGASLARALINPDCYITGEQWTKMHCPPEFRESWGDYVQDVVPSLLTSEGKALKEILKEDLDWDWTSWKMEGGKLICFSSELSPVLQFALGAKTICEVDRLLQPRALQFDKLLSMKLIRKELYEKKAKR